MVLYGIYNSDILEALIVTVYRLHNQSTWNEKLLMGEIERWYCYVRQYNGNGLFSYEMSRGKCTAYVYWVLQYTTAHLQVLFSSQHLGGITKVLQ